MKLFFMGMLAVGALVAQAGIAQAGALSELSAGQINELEDDNFESFFNQVGDDDVIDVGDRFLGTIAIQAINAPPGVFPSTYDPGATLPTFTGVFAIEAARIETVDGRTNVFYKPLETTDWSGEFGLDLPDPTDPNTIGVFFDDVTRGELLTSDDNTLQEAIDSFVGDNRVWEFGFEGADFADGVSDLGEFFVAAGAEGTDEVGASLLSITNLINLNLLEGIGIPLVAHAYLGGTIAELSAVDAGVTFTAAAQLQGIGGINAPTGLAFDFKTDTDLYVQPVPEPSSLAIFALGALGLARYRRRK